MIKRPFREHHLLNFLDLFSAQNLPMDLYMSHYFRSNKALGPKDRGFIAETAYGMIRWQGLLDYFCQNKEDWEARYQFFINEDLEKHLQNKEIPLHVRLSYPQCLYDLLEKSLGQEEAIKFCLASNKPAPTTVRINSLKTTREEILQRWQALYQVSPCEQAETGVQFFKKMNFFELEDFKQGLFEVQDEGSQLLAHLVKPLPGQQVLDYCAGSGGKTLAFAPEMKSKGQIYLHDIRPHALLEGRKRLKRAGIQNAQFIQPDSPALSKLKKKMDWVLADIPCSGTGTMRRNPDMKWKFTETLLRRLIGQQRMIFEKALSFLQPEGRIVYGTCSVLNEENEEQVAHFLKTYPIELEGDILKTSPSKSSMDGFFGAVFKLKVS